MDYFWYQRCSAAVLKGTSAKGLLPSRGWPLSKSGFIRPLGFIKIGNASAQTKGARNWAAAAVSNNSDRPFILFAKRFNFTIGSEMFRNSNSRVAQVYSNCESARLPMIREATTRAEMLSHHPLPLFCQTLIRESEIWLQSGQLSQSRWWDKKRDWQVNVVFNPRLKRGERAQ